MVPVAVGGGIGIDGKARAGFSGGSGSRGGGRNESGEDPLPVVDPAAVGAVDLVVDLDAVEESADGGGFGTAVDLGAHAVDHDVRVKQHAGCVRRDRQARRRSVDTRRNVAGEGRRVTQAGESVLGEVAGGVSEGNGKVGDRVGAAAEREVVVHGVACVASTDGRRLLVILAAGRDEGGSEEEAGQGEDAAHQGCLPGVWLRIRVLTSPLGCWFPGPPDFGSLCQCVQRGDQRLARAGPEGLDPDPKRQGRGRAGAACCVDGCLRGWRYRPNASVGTAPPSGADSDGCPDLARSHLHGGGAAAARSVRGRSRDS